MKRKIIIVAGARPNFIKIAPLVHEFEKYRKYFDILLVHTGQHYDFLMSEVFFKDLYIPEPDIYLNAGSASHAVQTAKIMTAFEKVALKERPDLVIVVGDVNSTLACSLVASKLNIKIAHIEAGLRSFDRTMPEEINRIITDALSDYLFVTEESGLSNLKREGIGLQKIFFVGNIMIDTLLMNMIKINKSTIIERLCLRPGPYAVLTLHRPDNVDSKKSFLEIYDILKAVSNRIKVIYPIHPRSRSMMRSCGILNDFKKLANMYIIDPLGYIDFIKLVKKAAFVMTDSGGIQEEATFLKVPCLTMRENTERPVTLKEGTNYLVGRDRKKIIRLVTRILDEKVKRKAAPILWDGRTSYRIVKILKRASSLHFDNVKV